MAPWVVTGIGGGGPAVAIASRNAHEGGNGMSDMAPGAGTGPRDRIVFAVVLIAVGVIGLASQLFEFKTDVGGWIVMLIGLGFLGPFAFTRQYGFLIPGGVMTGLGAGIVASQNLTL